MGHEELPPLPGWLLLDVAVGCAHCAHCALETQSHFFLLLPVWVPVCLLHFAVWVLSVHLLSKVLASCSMNLIWESAQVTVVASGKGAEPL